MTFKIKCDICGNEVFILVYDMDGRYSIVRCAVCGLWLSYPKLTDEELGEMYAKYHENWGVVGMDEDMHRKMRHETFRRLFHMLSRFAAPQGRLLDVGCATGICMEVAEEYGWDAYGVEISEEAASVARIRFGKKVKTLDFMNEKQDPAGHYDAVMLTDVLEHLNGVKAAMEKIHHMLKSGGIVTVVTVDTSSLLARLMRKRWPFIHRLHLAYFSKNNLNILLKKTGFEVLRFACGFKSVNLYYIRDYMRQKREESGRVDRLGRLIEHFIDCLPRKVKHYNFVVPTGDIVAIARKV